MNNRGPYQEPSGQLTPRPAVTLFDALHFFSTFIAGLEVATLVGRRFGGMWGTVAFVVTSVAAFFAFGYLVAWLVIFVHKRYSAQSRIGYEAACYVLAHFKRKPSA